MTKAQKLHKDVESLKVYLGIMDGNTVKQVAKEFEVSESSVRRLITRATQVMNAYRWERNRLAPLLLPQTPESISNREGEELDYLALSAYLWVKVELSNARSDELIARHSR